MYETIYAFANRLKVNHQTVRIWIKRGLIPCLRINGIIRIETEPAIAALRNYKARAEAKEPVTAS